VVGKTTTPVRYRGLRRHFVKARVRVHDYPDGKLAILHGLRCLAPYRADGGPLDHDQLLAAGRRWAATTTAVNRCATNTGQLNVLSTPGSRVRPSPTTSPPRSRGTFANSTPSEDLAVLHREIAEATVADPAVRRLLTIARVDLTVAAGLVAAIGDIRPFPSPQQLVSYFGLNPRVRQSGLCLAQHGRISKIGRSHARALLVEPA
jgi:hypothetical protein